MRWKPWLLMSAAVSQACFVCVARGAKVKTPRGPRNIEEFVVGDEVYAVEPETGVQHLTRITGIRTAKRECGAIDGLRLTSTHPLYDPVRHEWAPAGDWLLGVRTVLLTINGPKQVTQVQRFVGVDDVFDLSVEHPAHTFVVDGVVVHNKDYPEPLRTCSLPDGGTVTSEERDQLQFCPFESPSERPWRCYANGPALTPCGGSASRSFEVLWQHGLGSDDTTLLDGDTWSALDGDDAGQVLEIVPGDTVDFERGGRVLRVSVESSGYAVLTRAMEPVEYRTAGVYFRVDDGTYVHQPLAGFGPSSDGPGVTALGLHGTGESLRAYIALGGEVRVINTPIEPGRWYRADVHLSRSCCDWYLHADLFDATSGAAIGDTWDSETIRTTDPLPGTFAVGLFPSAGSEGTVYLGRPAVSDTGILGP